MRRWAAKTSLGLGLALLLAGFLTIVNPGRGLALSGSEFQAGRIMDDAVFFNSSTMNAAQIQDFLNAKVPVCDTNGTQPYNGTTRAAHSTSRGNPPPFICLRNFSQDVPLKGAEAGLCNGIGPGNKSGAQIIHEVSLACGVNPKVLIVLLQKEQSLITDDWPWPVQYRSATGFGCPDTAPCDAEYYGFFNQVYAAARQFRKYARDSQNYNYRANRNNFIQYNPASSCGGSTVFIRNQATAGLYVYTPYQPNQAALNNLYGTGDTCSAYGNRNFWRMYNDWFGSTLTPDYAVNGSEVLTYTDASATQAISHNTMIEGERVFMRLRFRNNGNVAWSNSGTGTVRLAAFGGDSPFCDATWINCARAVNMKEAVVGPGGTATFEFWYQAPRGAPGAYANQFGVIAEGVATMVGDQPVIYTYVVPALYAVNASEVRIYSDASMTQETPAGSMAAGEKVFVRMRFRNNGNVVWKNTGQGLVRLATMAAGNSPFCDATWLNCTRAVDMEESAVGPGGFATFKFWYKAPSQNGNYATRFGVLSEARATMLGDQPVLNTAVEAGRYTAQLTELKNYTDANATTEVSHNMMTAGQRIFIRMRFRNTGNVTWRNTGTGVVRLATTAAGNSPFCDPAWVSCVRPADMVEAAVPPGGIATFAFWYKAPASPTGAYATQFNLVSELVASMAGDKPIVYTYVNP